MVNKDEYRIYRRLLGLSYEFDIYDKSMRRLMVCKRSFGGETISFYQENLKGPKLIMIKQTYAKCGIFKKSTLYSIIDHVGGPLAYIACKSHMNWQAVGSDSSEEGFIREYTILDQYKKEIGAIRPDGSSYISLFRFKIGDRLVGRFHSISHIFSKYLLDLQKNTDKLLDDRVALAVSVILILNSAYLHKPGRFFQKY